MSDSTPAATQSRVGTSVEICNHWLLWVVAALLAALYAPTLIWLWDRWTLSVWHNGHGLLIALVVIYLVWGALKTKADLPRSSNPWGFAIVLPALGLHVLDTGIHSQLLSAVALIMSLPGFALLFLGTERTKLILFPLLTLFLTLPIPLMFTEFIHLALRHITADGVAMLLPLFGVPVFATGTLLELRTGSLQVVDACSGFSTLYATVAVAVLTAYFCTVRRRKILILLIAAPLAIGVNIVRVLVLAMLVHWTGLDVLDTVAHELSGLLTFVVAIPIIFWLGRSTAPVENNK
jgi:exosortase